MNKSNRLAALMIILLGLAGFFFLGLTADSLTNFNWQENFFTSPFVSDNAKEKPLQQYSIENLSQRKYLASPIVIEKILEENANYTSYLFSYTTTGKRMTGQINIPVIRAYAKTPKIILMLRGYLPSEDYQTGMGTKNAAASFTNSGYVTLAPDFLGYAGSEAESEDVWEARLTKPVNVVELIKSIKQADYLISDELKLSDEQQQSIKRLSGEKAPLENSSNLSSPGEERTSGTATAGQIGEAESANKAKVGIWAHSNGGQIAVSVLEILAEPIPTTLWAPMLAPFPYSILYFGWDEADEGKEQRRWISLFEEDYDVFDFSVTQHIDKLIGPLQIQHGSSDDQVLTAWIESFVDKAKTGKISSPLGGEEIESESRQSEDAIGEAEVNINYIEYPNADHNLQPVWNSAIQKDLQFFAENL